MIFHADQTRSFKLGQMLNLISKLPDDLKKILFFSYCPLQIWPLNTSRHQDILKTIIRVDRSFKLDKLVVDDEQYN